MKRSAAGERTRVAIFPRGLDGLFLPPTADIELLPLVERGSAEEAWAQSLWPTAQLLAYSLSRSDLGICPSTESLLLHSDIAALLHQSRASGLLLSCACSPAIFDWAERAAVRLLMPDYRHQRLEDKLWFDRFLRRHALPCPPGGRYTVGGRRLPVAGPAVLQLPSSLGGEGTFFLDSSQQLDELVARGVLKVGDPTLVRQRVSGLPYGITVLCTPSQIALSALRLQGYYPPRPGQSGQSFAGVQWVPTRDLSPLLQRRLDRLFLRLGQLLYQRRFCGLANFDFMVDERQRIFLIECNPRMSAATPQLFARPELCRLPAVGAALLHGFLFPRRFPRDPAQQRLPDSSYGGATLDLVWPLAGAADRVIARSFPSGHYGLVRGRVVYRGPELRALADGDGFSLYSYAQPGQRCQPGDSLGSLVSNAPLFDSHGALLPRAKRLLEHFRYTDDDRL